MAINAKEIFPFEEDRVILKKVIDLFHGKIVRISDMPKPNVIKLRRLWHNLASLRDYNVRDWVERQQTIKLECDVNGRKQTMTLTPELLEKGFQAHHATQKSRYSTREYQLIDYRWKEDKDEETSIKQDVGTREQVAERRPVGQADNGNGGSIQSDGGGT